MRGTGLKEDHRVVGCWLLIVGCWLLVVDCRFKFVCCLLLVVGFFVSAAAGKFCQNKGVFFVCASIILHSTLCTLIIGKYIFTNYLYLEKDSNQAKKIEFPCTSTKCWAVCRRLARLEFES